MNLSVSTRHQARINEASPSAAGSRQPISVLAASALSVLRLIAINFIVSGVLAELLCLVYINVTNWPSSKPSYRVNSFWADINPVFGVWHRPNGHYIHKGGCYNVEYVTNSHGARDVERTMRSSLPRTVVLGDSFIEGMAVPRPGDGNVGTRNWYTCQRPATRHGSAFQW